MVLAVAIRRRRVVVAAARLARREDRQVRGQPTMVAGVAPVDNHPAHISPTIVSRDSTYRSHC